MQGLLPKIKSELYLRMPADFNDFEKLCEKLFISEQILQNKESNEDKELTAVIAGITHHEKQQDEELTQQKLEKGILKQKLAELENFSKRRHSSQEQLATVAAVDHYESRRSSSLDHDIIGKVHSRVSPRPAGVKYWVPRFPARFASIGGPSPLGGIVKIGVFRS